DVVEKAFVAAIIDCRENTEGAIIHFIGGDIARKIHIPSLLVVNRWAAASESGSRHDFRFRHDVWTMIFHQLGERITSIISRFWHFTTKSGGIWDFARFVSRASIIAPATPFCFCTTQKHLIRKIAINSMTYEVIPIMLP